MLLLCLILNVVESINSSLVFGRPQVRVTPWEADIFTLATTSVAPGKHVKCILQQIPTISFLVLTNSSFTNTHPLNCMQSQERHCINKGTEICWSHDGRRKKLSFKWYHSNFMGFWMYVARI